MFDADAVEDGDEVDDLDLLDEAGDKAGSTQPLSPPSTAENEVEAGKVGGMAAAREDLENVEIRHTVSKSDTVLTIARKYAADVSYDRALAVHQAD
jgi:hypothetical protein